MKELSGYSEFVAGRVYNRIYVGNNSAYARINGKETFLVVETAPTLRATVLYDQFGNPFSEHIKGGVVTYPSPEIAFHEFLLFEPADESEWLKKSVKFSSLALALEEGLIMQEDVRQMSQWQYQCPFVASFGVNSKLQGVYASFSVEDKTEHPLLQTVYVVWPSWQELEADFRRLLGITVRT